MIPNLRLALIVSICTAKAMADTCLSQGELAGVVFGSVFGTLLICLSVGAVLYCFLRRSGKAKTTLVKAATSTEAPKIVDKGSDAEKAQKNDKVDALAAVALKSKDLSGLGFSVRGSMSEGIYIRDVLPQGPAQESQNVFAGRKKEERRKKKERRKKEERKKKEGRRKKKERNLSYNS
ncbi:unnamed protein product, partial [Mesorhabditis belari]|uniref:PDZ domain-containing protein n=1 Tax=Mesorhabditis belari TaxID=2138241 RepID=A0AAF3F373_9BILA